MKTTDAIDTALERIEAGEPLSRESLLELAASPDILSAGMLADAQKRALHGRRVTYLRVAERPVDAVRTTPVEPGAGELRLTGSPATLDAALAAVASARAIAGERALSALGWADVARLADASAQGAADVLRALREQGLDSLAEVAIDALASPGDALALLSAAGFRQIRLHVAKPDGAVERAALWEQVAAAQAELGSIASLNPLPLVLSAFRPTTGYDDVKAVALARLALPGVPHIQVDWRRYGPKLAQVALTFGADDVDGVSASDQAPEGRRRAPVEEIRRNIEAAGFEPMERSGRFVVGSA